jgi:hypothetical protein
MSIECVPKERRALTFLETMEVASIKNGCHCRPALSVYGFINANNTDLYVCSPTQMRYRRCIKSDPL